MSSNILKILKSLKSNGIIYTLDLARKNMQHEARWYIDRKFDRQYGTDTSDRIELSDLEIDGDREQGVYYEPTSTKLFTCMMESVLSDISCEDFVFIDYGSGKGRTLLLASDYNFRSVMGIEFSRELHLIAENNIKVYKSKDQKCDRIISVHSDASIFKPPSENLFVYFYNPFLKEVMVKVIESLEQVSIASGVRVLLVYFNPLSSDVIENSGLFQRQQEISLPRDYSREQQRKCIVYFSWSV